MKRQPDRTGTFTARLRREDGATAIVVAIALVMLLGASALAVDAGSLWRTRRDSVTNTDAAALAAARTLMRGSLSDCLAAEATGAGDAYDEADRTLRLNELNAGLNFLDFEVVCDLSGDGGHVSVEAEMPAQLTFAPFIGFGDVRAGSRSTAQWGPLVATDRLRPIGFCSQPNTDILPPLGPTGPYFEWDTIANGDPTTPAYEALKIVDYPETTYPDHPNSIYPGAQYVVHRIAFREPGSSPCNDGTANDAGNWGWLDFDGGPPAVPDPECTGVGGGGAKDLKCRLEHGYPGTVDLGSADDPGTKNCNETAPGTTECDAETGANNSVKSYLDALVCDPLLPADDPACIPKQITILAYSEVKEGPGTNLEYEPLAFVGAVLRGYNGVATGNPNADSYFDFEFIDLQRSGRIGNPLPGVTTIQGVGLCGADRDTVDNRCNF